MVVAVHLLAGRTSRAQLLIRAMRKLLITLLFLGAAATAQPVAAALKIFACEPEWAALAREIGTDKVETYSATTALQDVHKIQARPSLIAKFRQADLVICTGAGLEEGWLPALISKANNPRVLSGGNGYLEASRYVEMIEVPAAVDRSMGDVHSAGNPHIQTDPRNLPRIAEAIAKRMAQLDPANGAHYKQRNTEFLQRLQLAVTHWETKAAPLKGLRFVAMHKDWSYLARWLGLVQVGTLEPKPGLPPSAAHLARLVEDLKQKPADVILLAAYQDRKAAEWLAQRTGAPIIELPFTVGGNEFADDTLGLYAATIDALLVATGKAAAP